MGVDIMGWVEILKPGSRDWSGVVRIDGLVNRSYPMFYMLFGKRGGAHYAPLAAGRGLPEDLSEAASMTVEEGFNLNPSWLTWSELNRIDWDEPEPSNLQERVAEAPRRRKDYVPRSWSLLFHMMELLAGLFGDDKVRLVVWFDS